MGTVHTKQSPSNYLTSVAVNDPVTIVRQDGSLIFVTLCQKNLTGFVGGESGHLEFV
jgi:hypothetical protein